MAGMSCMQDKMGESRYISHVREDEQARLWCSKFAVLTAYSTFFDDV